MKSQSIKIIGYWVIMVFSGFGIGLIGTFLLLILGLNGSLANIPVVPFMFCTLGGGFVGAKLCSQKIEEIIETTNNTETKGEQ